MDGGIFDICIVGGGVVGCSCLFDLTNYGYNCVLLEKNQHLLSEASSGNRYFSMGYRFMSYLT